MTPEQIETLIIAACTEERKFTDRKLEQLQESFDRLETYFKSLVKIQSDVIENILERSKVDRQIHKLLRELLEDSQRQINELRQAAGIDVEGPIGDETDGNEAMRQFSDEMDKVEGAAKE